MKLSNLLQPLRHVGTILKDSPVHEHEATSLNWEQA